MNIDRNISEMYGISPQRNNRSDIIRKSNMSDMNQTHNHMNMNDQVEMYPQMNMMNMGNMSRMQNDMPIGTSGNRGTNIGTGGQNVRMQLHNNLSMQPTEIVEFTHPGNYGLQSFNGQNDDVYKEMTNNNMQGMTARNNSMSYSDDMMLNRVSLAGRSTEFLNGYMRTKMGNYVDVEFVMGETIVMKSGYLTGVGSNYILVTDGVTNDIVACDFSHVLFVRFYN